MLDQTQSIRRSCLATLVKRFRRDPTALPCHLASGSKFSSKLIIIQFQHIPDLVQIFRLFRQNKISFLISFSLEREHEKRCIGLHRAEEHPQCLCRSKSSTRLCSPQSSRKQNLKNGEELAVLSCKFQLEIERFRFSEFSVRIFS